MKKILYLLLCYCLITMVMSGCEKDDICAEETPTTPELILRFYDLASQNETKNVTGLYAYGLDDENNVIPFNGLTIGTNDSISIPLRIDANSTRFVLHKDFEIDDNGTPEDNTDDLLLGNPEVVIVNYEREDVYVSRACGYKTIFNNISFSVDIDGDNWIINSEIIKPNVEFEISAHVKIYH